MLAVLDPNVLVSAVLSSRGAPARLMTAWLIGEFELVVSPLLLDELERVLTHPKIAKRVGTADAVALLALLRERGRLCDDPADPDPIPTSDPDDDYLVALARSRSAALVSGDSDLHALGPAFPVFTPAAFEELLRG